MNFEEEAPKEKPELEMSLSFHLINPKMSIEQQNEIFNRHQVAFKDYDRDPYQMLFDQRLCFRIDDNIVESKIAIPHILSILSFDRELTKTGLASIYNVNLVPMNEAHHNISKIPKSNRFLILIVFPNLRIRIEIKLF